MKTILSDLNVNLLSVMMVRDMPALLFSGLQIQPPAAVTQIEKQEPEKELHFSSEVCPHAQTRHLRFTLGILVSTMLKCVCSANEDVTMVVCSLKLACLSCVNRTSPRGTRLAINAGSVMTPPL